uniref:Uncharacterized protein n=1 Tax=Ovis aries TaxID=9940 RepID=A0AC11E9R8_SHEEP
KQTSVLFTRTLKDPSDWTKASGVLPRNLLAWKIRSFFPSIALNLAKHLETVPARHVSLRSQGRYHLTWPSLEVSQFHLDCTDERQSSRIDWLDLHAVQGTLKSLLQHHSSKASTFQHSAFFMVQLSNPYKTTGKTIALTRRTFAGKVMSLLFNLLSRLVIAFPPRSKHLLISCLQLTSAVILEPPKIKSATFFSTVSPSICHDVMGPDAMI